MTLGTSTEAQRTEEMKSMNWMPLIVSLMSAPAAFGHAGHDHPVQKTTGITHYLFEHRYALIAVASALLIVGTRLLKRMSRSVRTTRTIRPREATRSA